MAKNILQTKKRVSHFQKPHKDFDGENELFACKDYVSSIIQDMDSNFDYIQSGYSKKDMECNKNFAVPEDSFLSSIPLLQIPMPSSSKGTLQTPVKKSKGFYFSRKFPLMEKSQKILKQLKHNQNIPKPRAHLAKIPKSPAKGKLKYISPKISVAKKKDVLNVKYKVTSNPCSKEPANHSPILNIKSSNTSEILKAGPVTKHSKPKNVENSIKDIPTIDTNTETNSFLESDSGMSDSEFERFVKKNKKSLQKKSSKRQKQNSRKSKSCTKRLKRKKRTCDSEQKNTIDCGVITNSSINFKVSPFKKQKIMQTAAEFNDLDYFDYDEVPDVSTRDSSESDDDLPISNIQQTSKACEVNPVTETILSGANSSQWCSNLNVRESNINSNLASSRDESSVQFEVEHIRESQIMSVADVHKSCENLLESNINSDKVPGEFLNENPINLIKIEKISLPSNLIIDIDDSDDDDCNNGGINASELTSENVEPTSIENLTKNLADPDSEESDIEIIEVKSPVQTIDKCSASMLANNPYCLNNVVSSEKHLEIVCDDIKPSIKNENLVNTSLANIPPVVKSQNDAGIADKNDVVYRTDICHTTMILEQRTSISSHCFTTQNLSSQINFQANPDLKVVKHEVGSDDDIFILDSVHSTKVVDSSNLPSAKTENIKSELSPSENKLKLLDPIDSGLGTNEINKLEKISDVVPISTAELLELYKMEFATYKEMKRANADVEASLKNLQAHQTEKMLFVRELLLKSVKGNRDNFPLVQTSRDCKDFISGNAQNKCNIIPNNSFSPNQQMVLPSTLQDIKLDKLKKEMQPVAIKPKVESVQDDSQSRMFIPKMESGDPQTLILLEEKCNVCGNDAIAACQKCAKVFFCSHECGRRSWEEGHVNVCGK